jgi:hypothetical protein
LINAGDARFQSFLIGTRHARRSELSRQLTALIFQLLQLVPQLRALIPRCFVQRRGRVHVDHRPIA